MTGQALPRVSVPKPVEKVREPQQMLKRTADMCDVMVQKHGLIRYDLETTLCETTNSH